MPSSAPGQPASCSHALASGPLAASQPGFTTIDPLAASLLGIFLFGEHMRAGTLDLAAEAYADDAVMRAAELARNGTATLTPLLLSR